MKKEKKKVYENPEQPGTHTLGEEELEEELAMKATLDGTVNIDETEERIRELEKRTTPEDFRKEEEELKEFGKKPKAKKKKKV